MRRNGSRRSDSAAAPGGRELALALGSVLLALLLAESAARLWVWRTWPAARVALLTAPDAQVRGRFRFEPGLGYGLVPGYQGKRFRHNRHGYRGGDFELAKPPGTLRVALLGGSTVYAPEVADEETSAYRLERRLRQALHTPVEVVNAGVPGWTSRETRMQLGGRVLGLEPDAVVILDGRNEIFPQIWRGYRDDYAHFRTTGAARRRLQAGWRRLFRVSHLALSIAGRDPGYLGFVSDLENPVYATVLWENQPAPEAVPRHARAPRRLEGYRRNLRAAVSLARQHDVTPVLVTMPFRPEGFRSAFSPGGHGVVRHYASLVAANNRVVREVAGRHRALLVDAAPQLSSAEYLVDDCHFNPAGEDALAAALAEALRPPLAARRRDARP